MQRRSSSADNSAPARSTIGHSAFLIGQQIAGLDVRRLKNLAHLPLNTAIPVSQIEPSLQVTGSRIGAPLKGGDDSEMMCGSAYFGSIARASLHDRLASSSSPEFIKQKARLFLASATPSNV
jgi:hypothetical protein